MGDRSTIPPKEGVAISSSAEITQPSIDILKKTKEMADITGSRSADDAKIQLIQNEDLVSSSHKDGNANVETVFENTNMPKTASSVVSDASHDIEQNLSSTKMSAESGRQNKLRDHKSNIFPAGIMGCKEDATMPSPRRLLDAMEAAKDSIGHIENTPRKMCVNKSEHTRNPLTGSGVEALDEVKSNTKKKVEGNPVTGTGYDDGTSTNNSNSRMPPGGISNGIF